MIERAFIESRGNFGVLPGLTVIAAESYLSIFYVNRIRVGTLVGKRTLLLKRSKEVKTFTCDRRWKLRNVNRVVLSPRYTLDLPGGF